MTDQNDPDETGLRGQLADALERIAALEKQTPQAQRLQHEADLAAADLAESGYDRPDPVGAERHGRGCLCPYCPGDEDEPEESLLARRDAYIGTWSNQDVTKRGQS